MSLGVFFRSDTRPPLNSLVESWRQSTEWEMFKVGFDVRDPKMKAYKHRFNNGKKQTFDLDPYSAVCVSRHFEASALFPIDNPNCDSFIYVVQLDADKSKMYNTQEKQWDYAKGLGFNQNQSQIQNNVLWPMFGQERGVRRIEPGEIIGAIDIERETDPFTNWTGKFKCRAYFENTDYSGTADAAKSAKELISPIVKKSAWIKTPTKAQGYKKSTGK